MNISATGALVRTSAAVPTQVAGVECRFSGRMRRGVTTPIREHEENAVRRSWSVDNTRTALGQKGRAVFVGPARAEIKVRYGNGGGLGKDLQRQTLDSLHARELKIGLWSLGCARMQILVPRGKEVTYDFYPASSLAIRPCRK